MDTPNFETWRWPLKGTHGEGGKRGRVGRENKKRGKKRRSVGTIYTDTSFSQFPAW